VKRGMTALGRTTVISVVPGATVLPTSTVRSAIMASTGARIFL
jgi:hypothetical protein